MARKREIGRERRRKREREKAKGFLQLLMAHLIIGICEFQLTERTTT
jgi:hypothetical protein